MKKNVKNEIKSYPLDLLIRELKKERGQEAATTMRHLEECRKMRLLEYDEKYVYAYVGILK